MNATFLLAASVYHGAAIMSVRVGYADQVLESGVEQRPLPRGDRSRLVREQEHIQGLYVWGHCMGIRWAASVVSPVLCAPAFLCWGQQRTTVFCACEPLGPTVPGPSHAEILLI